MMLSNIFSSAWNDPKGIITRMELRHLRYFVAVAEERSFRRAAMRVHISQPPLSRQIKELEEQVGAELFERTASGVTMTPAGRTFLDEARQALRFADDAVEKSRRVARGELGELRIAYFGSVILEVIPQVVAALHAAEPTINVRLVSLPKDGQVRALQEGRIDIGFSRFYRTEENIRTELVMEEPVLVALSSSHPFASKKQLPLMQLRDCPMVVFPSSRRPSFADEVIKFCDTAGFSPNIVHEAEDLMACLALVTAQIGVALVPASAISVRSAGLCFVPLKPPAPTSSLLCAYRAHDKNPLLSKLLGVIRNVDLYANLTRR